MGCMQWHVGINCPLDIVAFVCRNKILKSYYESSTFSQNPIWLKGDSTLRGFQAPEVLLLRLTRLLPPSSLAMSIWREKEYPYKAGEHHLRIVLWPCEVIAHTSIPSTAKSGRSGRVPERTVCSFHCWYITLDWTPFVLFGVRQFAYREFHKRVICLKQAITHIDIVPHISLTIAYVLT